MKKIVINLLVFSLVIGVILVLLVSFGSDEGSKYVYKDNRAHKVIEIKPKEYQCSECNMDIEDLRYIVELITRSGNTYFFDDIGCVVLWLKSHTPEIDKVMTKTLDTREWIAVEKAWYSRTARSPMGYGFAPYAERQEGFVPYKEMKTLMLQGKNLHDPFVKKQLLSPKTR